MCHRWSFFGFFFLALARDRHCNDGTVVICDLPLLRQQVRGTMAERRFGLETITVAAEGEEHMLVEGGQVLDRCSEYPSGKEC